MAIEHHRRATGPDARPAQHRHMPAVSSSDAPILSIWTNSADEDGSHVPHGRVRVAVCEAIVLTL